MRKRFSSWSDDKKYAAALFFLGHCHSPPISEAQWGRLNALQMQISYGEYSEKGPVREFALCSVQERRRRLEDWKKVATVPKHIAVRQFLDLMDNLFPNWVSTRTVADEFTIDWSHSSSPRFSILSSTEVPSSCSMEKRSLRVPAAFKEQRSEDAFPTARKALQEFETQQLMAIKAKLPKLSAQRDVALTTSRIASDANRSRQDSKYYRIARSTSGTDRHTDSRTRKELEELYESLSSGKLETKRDRTFMHNLEEGVSAHPETAVTELEQHLRSHTPLQLPTNVSFPADLETILRPQFEFHIQLLTDVERVLQQEAGQPSHLLQTIKQEFKETIKVIFQYAKSAREKCETLEKQLEDANREREECKKDLLDMAGNRSAELAKQLETVEFEYDVQRATLSALVGLYSPSSVESERLSAVEYQLEVSRGLTLLKHDSALHALAKYLQTSTDSLATTHSNLVRRTAQCEKLRENIRSFRTRLEAGETLSPTEVGAALIERDKGSEG